MAQVQHAERRNGAARNAVKARASDVLDDFTELRKDVNSLADAAGKAAKIEAKHARQRLSGVSRDLRTRATDSVDYAADTVREHPGAAVGLSLGAGLLLGLLLTRR
jgi:ElaB/YqjD/DUF883 family membrane-anchored ribosome-binding protein